MSSRPGELLDQGLDFFTTICTRLKEDDWERPTPCAGWTARDVPGHLGVPAATWSWPPLPNDRLYMIAESIGLTSGKAA